MKKDLDLREIITNQVIEGLEKAGSWKQLWNKTKNYYNPITKKHYSFMNSILLLVQMAGREKDNDNKTFMTFKEIQKISAKVNKGAKAYDIYLYLPCYYNKLTKQYLTYKEYMLLSDLEKKNVDSFPVLRNYKVFSTSDITFKTEEDKEKYTQVKLTEHKYTNKDIDKTLKAYFEKENIKLTCKSLSNRAFYRPSEHSITCPKREQFADLEEFYSTLFHESVHSTSKTLKREISTSDKEKYSFEELVAELGAMMLCEHFNINSKNKENSIAYIKGWAEYLKENTNAIIKASTQSEKAVKYILGE